MADRNYMHVCVCKCIFVFFFSRVILNTPPFEFGKIVQEKVKFFNAFVRKNWKRTRANDWFQ